MTRFARITRPEQDEDRTYTPAQFDEDLVVQDRSDPEILSLIPFDQVSSRGGQAHALQVYARECQEVVQGSLKVPDGEYTVTVMNGVAYALLPGTFDLNRALQ